MRIDHRVDCLVVDMLLLFANAFSAYATAYVLSTGTSNLVSVQIRFFLQGNTITGKGQLGYALASWMIIIMPSHVFAALQRIAYDADRDPGLAPYLPKGGMMAAVRALHQRFAAGPIRVTIRDDVGKAQTVVLGAEDLQLALLAHTDEAERWPAFILSLYYGHYDACSTGIFHSIAISTMPNGMVSHSAQRSIRAECRVRSR